MGLGFRLASSMLRRSRVEGLGLRVQGLWVGDGCTGIPPSFPLARGAGADKPTPGFKRAPPVACNPSHTLWPPGDPKGTTMNITHALTTCNQMRPRPHEHREDSERGQGKEEEGKKKSILGIGLPQAEPKAPETTSMQTTSHSRKRAHRCGTHARAAAAAQRF